MWDSGGVVPCCTTSVHTPTALPCEKELAVLIGPLWPDFGDEKNLFCQPEIEFRFLSFQCLAQLLYQLEGMIILKWILHK